MQEEILDMNNELSNGLLKLYNALNDENYELVEDKIDYLRPLEKPELIGDNKFTLFFKDLSK